MSLYVKSYDNESADNLLKRFKRQLKADGRFLEMKKHEYYMSKSQKNKLKKRRKRTTTGETFKNET